MTGPHDLVLGTAGHIDHGKTALVRALTGVDTDRLPAEKQRGITIDLGFAALQAGRDPPGARRRAGARAIHPQHAGGRLGARPGDAGGRGRRLGDAADARAPGHPPPPGPDRGPGRPDEVRPRRAGLAGAGRGRRADLVAGTFLEGKPIVRTSAATGQGIDALREALLAHLPRRRRSGPIPASSAWPSIAPSPWRGTGRSSPGRWPRDGSRPATTCSGTPRGGPVRVRGLHRHDRPVDGVGRGTRAAINLVGVHHSEIRRGQEIGDAGLPGGVPGALGRVAGLARRRAAVAASGTISPPPGHGRGLGRPGVAGVQQSGSRRHGPGPVVPVRAGGRRPRPAVRAPGREPAGDARRGTRAPALGASDSPPRSRRGRPTGPAAVARPRRAPVGRAGLPRHDALDRAGALPGHGDRDRRGLPRPWRD